MTFALSYSRWSLWAKCPAAYRYKHIEKVEEPYSDALAKGRKTHDEIAKYIAGAADVMPESLHNFKRLAEDLRATMAATPDRVHIEHQMAFDEGLGRVSWFGKSCAWRMIWDVGVETSPTRIDAVDWKTGRRYASYDDQKQLFALPAFWAYPDLQEFHGHWCYLDSQEVGEEVDSEVFTRDQAERLTRVWQGNRAMMAADRTFAATPSDEACRFCSFSWRNKGPCKEGV